VLRSLSGAALAIAAVITLTPSAAQAAPIELQRRLDGFWLFDDVDGTVEGANWFFREPFYEGYRQVEDGFLAVHPDDSQFLVIYTTWSLPVGIGALYQATANDVQGVGYEHIAALDAVIPEPYFDDTPNSQVQGFLHLNRWTQYLGNDDGLDDATISLIFGQEFGHAWLAFPYYVDEGGVTRDDLLGRSDAHWSFYMHTGGSPVQGHDWVDNGDGTFTAQSTDLFEFSDLDLYLMGLVEAGDVEPFFLLRDVDNCVDSALGDGTCAPDDAFGFEADTYTVTATRQDVTIDQIIAAEGPRVPAFGDAPTQWDVSFLLVKRPDETLSEVELSRMQDIVARSIELLDDQTRGLGAIINRTAGVEDPAPPEPSADDSTTTPGDGTGHSSDGGASTGAGTTDPRDTAPSSDTDADGCGCRTTDPRRTPWWAALGLLTFRRRRRRAPRRPPDAA
jgi:MYXO-CTERM domain-containing protein